MSKKGPGWFKDRRRHQAAAKKGWQNRLKGMKPSHTTDQLRDVQEARPQRARAADSRKTAKRVLSPYSPFVGSWAKNPGDMDIEGIDTFSGENGEEVLPSQKEYPDWYEQKFGHPITPDQRAQRFYQQEMTQDEKFTLFGILREENPELLLENLHDSHGNLNEKFNTTMISYIKQHKLNSPGAKAENKEIFINLDGNYDDRWSEITQMEKDGWELGKESSRDLKKVTGKMVKLRTEGNDAMIINKKVWSETLQTYVPWFQLISRKKKDPIPKPGKMRQVHDVDSTSWRSRGSSSADKLARQSAAEVAAELTAMGYKAEVKLIKEETRKGAMGFRHDYSTYGVFSNAPKYIASAATDGSLKTIRKKEEIRERMSPQQDAYIEGLKNYHSGNYQGAIHQFIIAGAFKKAEEAAAEDKWNTYSLPKTEKDWIEKQNHKGSREYEGTWRQVNKRSTPSEYNFYIPARVNQIAANEEKELKRIAKDRRAATIQANIARKRHTPRVKSFTWGKKEAHGGVIPDTAMVTAYGTTKAVKEFLGAQKNYGDRKKKTISLDLSGDEFVKVGESTYSRERLTMVAEEIHGRRILSKRGGPLKPWQGKSVTLTIKVHKQPKKDEVLIIQGNNGIEYIQAPRVTG